MKINCDKKTLSWLNNHMGAQTTLVMCEECGLFYKPSFGHDCQKEAKLKEMRGEAE